MCHRVQSIPSSEPECGTSSDLQFMYSFVEDKFSMKQEIKELKEAVGSLGSRLSKLEIEATEPPACITAPAANIVNNYMVVTQSSDYSHPKYPAQLAVDGNPNTFSHTGTETDPWWSLEFSSNVVITKVRLRIRPDCCDDQVSNAVVTVDNVLCGRTGGRIGIGNSLDVICPEPLTGKILKVQRFVESQYLSIAEVQVFSPTKAS